MAIPVGSFNFSANGLIIQFMDSSTNTPTSWAWDFGDSLGTSTQKNPSYTYSAAGNYTVILTPTNGDGTADPYELLITVTESGSMGFTIEQMVELELPASFTLDPSLLSLYIKRWQLTLYGSFTPPVELINVHDQNSYSALANLLIARLVTYDLIIKSTESLMLIDGSLANPQSGSQKSIKTGPTEVEWYNPAEQASKLSYGSNSAFSSIKESICGLASTLGIYLKMCGPKKGPVIWDKVPRPCTPCESTALFVPSWFYIGGGATLPNEC